MGKIDFPISDRINQISFPQTIMDFYVVSKDGKFGLYAFLTTFQEYGKFFLFGKHAIGDINFTGMSLSESTGSDHKTIVGFVLKPQYEILDIEPFRDLHCFFVKADAKQGILSGRCYLEVPLEYDSIRRVADNIIILKSEKNFKIIRMNSILAHAHESDLERDVKTIFQSNNWNQVKEKTLAHTNCPDELVKMEKEWEAK